mmetsp:Transcript_20404/g.59174  ORF Transcript_20404/g.59174 Transcript_20404/m.59174 type:complete len:223 (-) Transcript_20404:936-1604(-)
MLGGGLFRVHLTNNCIVIHVPVSVVSDNCRVMALIHRVPMVANNRSEPVLRRPYVIREPGAVECQFLFVPDRFLDLLRPASACAVCESLQVQDQNLRQCLKLKPPRGLTLVDGLGIAEGLQGRANRRHAELRDVQVQVVEGLERNTVCLGGGPGADNTPNNAAKDAHYGRVIMQASRARLSLTLAGLHQVSPTGASILGRDIFLSRCLHRLSGRRGPLAFLM